jgi:hypothetical protein
MTLLDAPPRPIAVPDYPAPDYPASRRFVAPARHTPADDPVGTGRLAETPRLRPLERRIRLGPEQPIPADVGGWGRIVIQQPAPNLPDPTAVCAAVVRAAVEVLRGVRPAAHLARWVTPVVFDQLSERAKLQRAVPPDQAPVFPVRIRRVRLDRHADAAEATVVIDDEGRCRAAAVRLEPYRGQWRVAVLELG